MRLFTTGLVIFLVTVSVIELLICAVRNFRNPYSVRMRKRVKALSSYARQKESIDIVRNRVLSHVPFLNRTLAVLPGIRVVDRLVLDARVAYPPGFFLLLSAVLGLSGFLLSQALIRHTLLNILAAAVAAAVPLVYLCQKRRRRLQKFERQLPDALDLIARSLRAGHALTGAMRMVADEFDEPLGPEFEATVDEINFGPSVPKALENLAARVVCPDLSFFVAAVLLQRDSGGNLAEIMESLADLIRERFKFRGKIRTLSAEGRLTAGVLIAIPFFVGTAVSLLNPEYIGILYTTPEGRLILSLAALLMLTGVVVIRRMIRIEV